MTEDNSSDTINERAMDALDRRGFNGYSCRERNLHFTDNPPGVLLKREDEILSEKVLTNT
jgi:hypothetical protein